MNITYDFTGQVALATGAGSGMGLDTARAFAKAGAEVTLGGPRRDSATEGGGRVLNFTLANVGSI